MQQLTFKNALADAVYFAKNVKLPFDNSTKSSPENAVCILPPPSLPSMIGTDRPPSHGSLPVARTVELKQDGLQLLCLALSGPTMHPVHP
jgi:hypothetical protein